MLKKPNIYDEIEIKEFSYTPLELGAHKGIIKKVEEYTSDFSGNTSLKVYVDTASDDKQPNYFMEQFKNDTRPDKKYPNSAIKYVSLREDETCVRMLKSFLTCIEKSNSNFKFDWNKEVDQLNNKKIGLVFGLEEYEKQDGSVGTTTKLVQFRSLDKLSEITIPKVKKLDGSYVEYEKYQPTTNNNINSNLESLFANSPEISDEEMPF